MPHSDRSLTHAAQDPATCLARGLFRSLNKKEKRKRLDVTSQYGQQQFRFLGAYELGVDDMRALQVLVALAGIQKQSLPVQPKTPEGVALRAWLGPSEAPDHDWVRVETSYDQMHSHMRMALCKKNREDLHTRLLRLENVTIWVVGPGKVGQRDEQSFHMIRVQFLKDGAIMALLNPYMARAALGRDRYARIDLIEAGKLKTDPARLLHQRLSAVIDPGNCTTFSIATLCEYIWPEPARTESSEKGRKKTVRHILRSELGGDKPDEGLQWRISECGKGVFKIQRPAVPQA